jgi:hypothetical protein
MTRRGKIARLPQPIREQINRRLENGEEGKQIIEWLNTLPEVAALMKGEFDGQPINEPNLSHWKAGGFREWEEHQEALEVARCFVADAAELGQVAGGRLADQLALCATARIGVALREPRSAGEDAAAQLDRLRRLCADLARMRKGDHKAEWLRIERERLDLARKKYKDEAAVRKRELDEQKTPEAHAITKEAWEALERDLRLL